MIALFLAAALAAKIDASTLSPDARYDLTCASEALWGMTTDPDEKTRNNLLATLSFYIGRLDVRDPSTKWAQVADQENKSAKHDLTWHNQALVSCARTMAERLDVSP